MCCLLFAYPPSTTCLNAGRRYVLVLYLVLFVVCLPTRYGIILKRWRKVCDVVVGVVCGLPIHPLRRYAWMLEKGTCCFCASYPPLPHPHPFSAGRDGATDVRDASMEARRFLPSAPQRIQRGLRPPLELRLQKMTSCLLLFILPIVLSFFLSFYHTHTYTHTHTHTNKHKHLKKRE